MKILFPYLARWRSANRSRYHQLLTHLCEFGHEVFVLTAPELGVNDISAHDLERGNDALPAGLTVSELYVPDGLRSFLRRRIPRTKLLKKGIVSVTSILQIRRFIAREKIDILLVYNLPQAPLLYRADCDVHFDLADDLVAMMQVEHKGIARLGGMHAARAVQNFMLKRARTVTVASNVLKNQIARPVLMLPNGANVEELDRADGRAWRARTARPTVGFVGAFEYWVNFDLLLDVAARLPETTFLLVGTGRRLPYIQEGIRERGLDNVVLPGAVPYEQAMNYVAGMDVCLLPFHHNAVSDGSCPLKLFEYAALRKPIISTSTTEVQGIGQGWVAFADDAPSIAEAVRAFLADPDAARRAGEQGRALVEQIYSWPKLARRFEQILMNQTVTSLEAVGAHRGVMEPLPSEIKSLP